MGFKSWIRNEWKDIKGGVKVEIYKAVASGSLIASFIAFYKSMQHVHFEPYLFGSVFLLSATLFFYYRNRPLTATAIPQPTTQGSDLTSGGTTALKNTDEFYKTYDNALLIEVEGKLRENAEQYHSGVEREKFLLRTLSTTFLIYVFDSIWYNIFGSQLRALQDLNSKPLKVNELRKYYDSAVAANPNFFVNYEFDQWLRFLFSWVLLSQKLEVVEITVRGREFLKYLVHNGKPISERSN